MLQSYDPYYRVVPNILGENTKKELLEIALKQSEYIFVIANPKMNLIKRSRPLEFIN